MLWMSLRRVSGLGLVSRAAGLICVVEDAMSGTHVDAIRHRISWETINDMRLQLSHIS